MIFFHSQISILIFGFGVLLLSQFVLNSDLGLFCAIAIVLALFADFVILPAFILKYDTKKVVDETIKEKHEELVTN